MYKKYIKIFVTYKQLKHYGFMNLQIKCKIHKYFHRAVIKGTKNKITLLRHNKTAAFNTNK